MNLIENAASAIEDRGEIVIAVEHHDQRIHIEVRDNGRGIEEERIQSLFDFGFTNKRGRVGLRLGLPSNKRTIEQLGGFMSVVSRPGEGTRVCLELPAME